MTIEELNMRLDNAISKFEVSAGKANSFCDPANGYAFVEIRNATKQALLDFKAEILTYLSQS